MDSLPEEIYVMYLSKFLTFKDLGNLIQSSKFFRNIYDTNDFWKKIYIMTCPDKWEFTENSRHLDYSKKLYLLCCSLCSSCINDLEIDIHASNNIFKIWNCQNNGSSYCGDITHYDITTLKSKEVRNYNYKNRVLDKARSRLVHKDKNIIFLKQLIIPDRLEWYDIIGNPTY